MSFFFKKGKAWQGWNGRQLQGMASMENIEDMDKAFQDDQSIYRQRMRSENFKKVKYFLLSFEFSLLKNVLE